MADIFIRALPEQCTDRQLTNYLAPILKPLDTEYLVRKLKAKASAILTLSSITAAKKFTAAYCSLPNSRTPAQLPLIFLGKKIYCSPARDPPDPFVVQGLRQQKAQRSKENHKPKKNHTCAIDSISCGQWSFARDRLSIVLGDRSLVIFLVKTGEQQENVRIDIEYYAVESITTGTLNGRSTITFSLLQSPTFSSYKLEGEQFIEEWKNAFGTVQSDQIEEALAILHLSSGSRRNVAIAERQRILGLDVQHNIVAGPCLVYQVVVTDPKDLNAMQNTLRNTHGTPPICWHPTSRHRRYDFLDDFQRLIMELTDPEEYGLLSFEVLYQVQALAQNGVLSPKAVRKLLPWVKSLSHVKDYDKIALAEGIRALWKILPSPGPDTDPKLYSLQKLVLLIDQKAASFKHRTSEYAKAKLHDNHFTMVHKVLITPTGTYLSGPDLDTKNRVLRKYSSYQDYFIRVTFADEDGQPVHLTRNVNGKIVYRTRFASILDGSINVAGRRFFILGWSHSSLRTHQCWFAAPFWEKESQRLINARDVIKQLGDFSGIKVPSKTAARIGQAFSDSTDNIDIEPSIVVTIGDIERNGRVFSDGVGQISRDLLRRVWTEFRRTRKQHASIVQIRFQGAKGILALNPVLKGEQLVLRRSMTKFPGSQDFTLEICGASYKRLPMFCNRQLIKILEDMGTDPAAIIALQEKAIQNLQYITMNPVNAAHFLEFNMVGLAARVPRLIRSLHTLELDFKDDSFLRDCVELAALVQLRDLKHRARIPVENGATLYGTVDETGILKEREIYVPVRSVEGKRGVMLGRCLITRSPALHPGDVQMVHAVNVPLDSSLNRLHNCVVFSQHGSRDLPSMLSGGDLDGDLYNVIFEPSLWPREQFVPADYPRTEAMDLGRPVTIQDMTDFFLTFMESDKLGEICVKHMIVADQQPEGSLHPACLKLAEMASTAVDFSKTGIPVNMSQMPREAFSRAKPDFMATTSKLVMDKTVKLEDIDEVDYDQNDPVKALDPGVRQTVYYPSGKILGRLYRNIDERTFLDDMQRHHTHSLHPAQVPLLNRVWSYVRRETKLIQWSYQVPTARNVRETYEENLLDTMHTFADSAREPLSELEVFTGNILGKSGGNPSARTKQYAMDMKIKADEDVQYIIEWILRDEPAEETINEHDDDDDNNMQKSTATNHERNDEYDGYQDDVALGGTNEALERSIACFYVAMHEDGMVMKRRGPMRSFAYVAAAVCLQEVERFKHMVGLT